MTSKLDLSFRERFTSDVNASLNVVHLLQFAVELEDFVVENLHCVMEVATCLLYFGLDVEQVVVAVVNHGAVDADELRARLAEVLHGVRLVNGARRYRSILVFFRNNIVRRSDASRLVLISAETTQWHVASGAEEVGSLALAAQTTDLTVVTLVEISLLDHR